MAKEHWFEFIYMLNYEQINYAWNDSRPMLPLAYFQRNVFTTE